LDILASGFQGFQLPGNGCPRFLQLVYLLKVLCDLRREVLGELDQACQGFSKLLESEVMVLYLGREGLQGVETLPQFQDGL
jgi:hypothetical protein